MYIFMYINSCVYIHIYTQIYIHLNAQICTNIYMSMHSTTSTAMHSLLHLKCYLISISNLNLFGFFPTERDKKNLEN